MKTYQRIEDLNIVKTDTLVSWKKPMDQEAGYNSLSFGRNNFNVMHVDLHESYVNPDTKKFYARETMTEITTDDAQKIVDHLTAWIAAANEAKGE